ncbi:MAG: AzlC family ABC transporter permease [Rhodocyclaceae bacterium]|nr:AzlC family ABC transporter permease [Rhodocyclaceae bacterium]
MTPVAAFFVGVRALLPMLVGVTPFGMLYGAVALQAGLSPLAAMLMSSLVFAGSAQFVMAQLIATSAPALLVFGAATLINLRHALYSASVAPALKHLAPPWKALLAYLLTDEAFAAAASHLLAEPRSPHAHWILFGAGAALWLCWQLATLAGILIGPALPEDLGLDFALPLTFISILVPLIDDRARLAAALTAAALAVALAWLPYNAGLVIAMLGGLMVGVLGGVPRGGSAR